MRKLLFGTSAALLSALLLASCLDANTVDDCNNTRTCADSSSGGSGTGGGAGSSSGGTGDGGSTGGSSACAETCAAPKGVCDEDAKKCVECLKDEQCSDGVCDEASKSCVECVEHADCGAATKPLCENSACTGCSAKEDCEQVGLAQCLPSGACVACTSETDCEGKVCDPETNTCTNLDAHELNACETCEHDAQCQVGQVCVGTTYSDPTEGSVGNFCLWRKDATGVGAPNGVCGTFRPFAQSASITSVDGATTNVCQLATTTCVAFLQYRTTVAGCTTPGIDDAACGAAGFNDGLCRLDGDSLPKCTYRCDTNEDCKAGRTCPATGDQYCSL